MELIAIVLICFGFIFGSLWKFHRNLKIYHKDIQALLHENSKILFEMNTLDTLQKTMDSDLQFLRTLFLASEKEKNDSIAEQKASFTPKTSSNIAVVVKKKVGRPRKDKEIT